MSDPFPSLEAHLAYGHAFSVDEIATLGPYELLELHDDEHEAGYTAHSHEETA